VTLYDRIGGTYGDVRRPDPRFEAAIRRALGDARTVVNVGAGTGSYEPADLDVTAVEPSAVMIAQRPAGAARAVQASAEALPFPDGSFDAALAVMTLHHWRDPEAGLAELVRVARRRVVILTFDPTVWPDQWIVRDYLPEVLDQPMPALERVLAALPPATVETVPAPNDCADLMFATLWARPEAHLDPEIRSGSSVWAVLPDEAVARALAALERDLASGEWDRRYGELRTTPAWDVGFRLIRAEKPGV
jgi:SAM-dependent methyltransferase